MVICGSKVMGPLCRTSPDTKTRWLFIAVTTTVTRGSAINFFSFSVIESFNCSGVNPAAGMSFSKGIEILPSGRTGRVSERSGSFQTEMRSMSSAPIT